MALPDPARSPRLVDARRQLHHAAQLATAIGISYLPRRSDDSHTNLEWNRPLAALVSRAIPAPALRVGVRAADLNLLLLDGAYALLDQLALSGQTMETAAAWLRERLARHGADAARFTLAKHYVIPEHPLDSGAEFDTTDAPAFEQLASWFDSASIALDDQRAAQTNASELRCWPHHFDLAFLIEPHPGTSVGVGLEPGDVYYDEPYYYVNMYPAPPAADVSDTLDGGGTWHTHEWIGAVLPGSRLTAGEAQRTQVRTFLSSAIAAAHRHLDASAAAMRG